MIAALVLAGGQGTRLGGVDKAFVVLDGVPLLDRLLARLGRQAGMVAISANGDPARFSKYGLAVLPDGRFAGKGPLAGVAAGLAWARELGAESLVTLPVDTPFVPADLVSRLSPAPAVAVWRGRQHHLVSHWPVPFLAGLEAFMTAPGAYKVRDALALARARQVHFDEPADPFLNINTPEDLESAKILALENG
jgi:molybdopterin-guanine dinucleotide biosynthesis protein A